MLLLPVALSLSVVISAALLLWALATQRRSLAYLFKPLTTALLIVLAITAPAPGAEAYRRLVVGGLLFGLAVMLQAHVHYAAVDAENGVGERKPQQD